MTIAANRLNGFRVFRGKRLKPLLASKPFKRFLEVADETVETVPPAKPFSTVSSVAPETV